VRPFRSGLVVVFILAACGRPPVAGTAALMPTVHDSAGVRIVDYPGAALDSAPVMTIDSTIAVIGRGNDSLDLSRVDPPTMLPGGGIAVFTQGTIHVFSPDGSHEEMIGRKGAGPGEFNVATLARGLGDTLLASDRGNSRVSWIVPGAGVVRQEHVGLNSGRLMYDVVAGYRDDTLILGTMSYMVGMNVAPGRLPLGVGRVTPGVDTVHEILPLEGTDFMSWSGPMPGGASVPARAAAARYTPFAYGVQWGDDGFFAARTDHWKLDRYNPAGRRVLSVRLDRSRDPITATMRDSDVAVSLAQMQARAHGSFDADGYRKWLSGLPYEDSLPAFDDPASSPGGTLWVRLPTMRYDSNWTYVGFGDDGRIVGRVSGSGHAPLAFGDDRIVLRHEDESGIVTFVVKRMRIGRR
jgi:hypothetical protein